MELTEAKTTFQKYPAYKDSGVEWLGEIPEGWETLPGLSFITEGKDKNKGMKRNSVLSLSYGNIREKADQELTGLVPESFETYQLVNKGDLIFRPTDLQNDKVSLRSAISKYDGIITSAYLNLRIKKKASSKFYHYFFRAIDNNKVIYGLGSGLRQNISYLDFRRFLFPFPPIEEQTAIANFLDDKTAKIDQAIAQKEKMIALLKERKQIIIQNAVTGKWSMVNGQWSTTPKEKMKDSGVEWIGEIPEHYLITKLGLCVNPVSIKNRPDLPLLSITRELGVIVRDVEDQESNHNFIPDDLSGYKVIRKGQFGMNKMKAWQGSYGVSQYDGIISPAYYVFDLISDINPDFFHLAVRSKIYVPFFAAASDGVRIGQWDLNKSRMKQIPIVVPPVQEQIKAIEHIKTQSKKIANAISQQKKQIKKLKEYKATLIDSAVTGKLRVPSVQEIKVS